jgi:hypothetical protein
VCVLCDGARACVLGPSQVSMCRRDENVGVATFNVESVMIRCVFSKSLVWGQWRHGDVQQGTPLAESSSSW